VKSNFGKTFKQLFFTYLLVSKVMYWIDNFASVESWRAFGGFFAERMLNQDIMVILVILAMFVLEKYLYPENGEENEYLYNLKLMGIGLFVFLALIVGYQLLMGFIFNVRIENWRSLLTELTMIYIIIAFAVYVKEQMKKKEVETYLPCVNDPKTQRSMLYSLHEAGLLTEAELTNKIEQIDSSNH